MKEKAFKILNNSKYYKQLQGSDECFEKAKEAIKIIGEKFGTKEFVTTGYVVTGVEKNKTPEEFLSSLTSANKHNPKYYRFRKNSKLGKYINSVYKEVGFKYVSNSPIFYIDCLGEMRTEKIKKDDEVYIKITYNCENIELFDNWEEIKMSEFYKLKEELAKKKD